MCLTFEYGNASTNNTYMVHEIAPTQIERNYKIITTYKDVILNGVPLVLFSRHVFHAIPQWFQPIHHKIQSIWEAIIAVAASIPAVSNSTNVLQAACDGDPNLY